MANKVTPNDHDNDEIVSVKKFSSKIATSATVSNGGTAAAVTAPVAALATANPQHQNTSFASDRYMYFTERDLGKILTNLDALRNSIFPLSSQDHENLGQKKTKLSIGVLNWARPLRLKYRFRCGLSGLQRP